MITGYAATEPVTVSGRVLKEDPSLARDRANAVVEWFTRLGYPSERIVVKTDPNPKPVDMDGAHGLKEASKRRVEIDVIP